jgi:hypothetical protein
VRVGHEKVNRGRNSTAGEEAFAFRLRHRRALFAPRLAALAGIRIGGTAVEISALSP